MTLTTTSPLHLADDEAWTTAHGPILVAADGTPSSAGALRAAAAMAKELHSPVRVLSIVNALVAGVPELELMSPAELYEQERADQQEVLVRDQLAGCVGPEVDWPIDVRVGLPAQAIAAEGDTLDAPVVITGLGAHALRDRVLGSETAIYVARYGQTPVLSVPEQFVKLPDVAVVAVDFSQHSIRAARCAIRLFPGLRELHLVHVFSPGTSPGVTEMAELLRFARELDLADTLSVTPAVVDGERAGPAVQRYARSVKAGLVVAGAHGRGFFSRLVLGSVSTSLLRSTETSVLVVPPASGGPRLFHARLIRGRRAPSATWRQLLADFSTRNAGHACVLEVDDPALGARVQASRHAFLGAAYDRRDARVEIMVGDPGGSGAHLTRNIPAVTSVVAALDGERREVLHIGHRRGETLLTILD